MSVDEGLNPSTSGIVLNLHDVGEDDGAIVFDQELESGGVAVEFAIESVLGRSNGILQGDSGGGAGNVLWSLHRSH
jgi:hypothetical protein